MSGHGWILAIGAVAVLVAALILTGHVEQWPDSDIRDLWWPIFAVGVIGVIVWYFARKKSSRNGGE